MRISFSALAISGTLAQNDVLLLPESRNGSLGNMRYEYEVCAGDVIKCIKRATKGFILIRQKRYQIHSRLQLSSSIAFFAWKPIEFRSYGGA